MYDTESEMCLFALSMSLNQWLKGGYFKQDGRQVMLLGGLTFFAPAFSNSRCNGAVFFKLGKVSFFSPLIIVSHLSARASHYNKRLAKRRRTNHIIISFSGVLHFLTREKESERT